MRYHNDLTRFTVADITSMLEDSGYNETSKDIYSVQYVSTTNGYVKYTIKFELDSIGDTGSVYVFIDKNGHLSCDY